MLSPLCLCSFRRCGDCEAGNLVRQAIARLQPYLAPWGGGKSVFARIAVPETAGYWTSLALTFGQLALALLICPGISSNSAAAPLS